MKGCILLVKKGAQNTHGLDTETGPPGGHATAAPGAGFSPLQLGDATMRTVAQTATVDKTGAYDQPMRQTPYPALAYFAQLDGAHGVLIRPEQTVLFFDTETRQYTPV